MLIIVLVHTPPDDSAIFWFDNETNFSSHTTGYEP